MSRINTNVTSLIAQNVLGRNNFGLNQSLQRLSTGLRINRGKDDPAGLIASENLRAEITSLNSAVGNAERADQVVNIAEGGLDEVSGRLRELQGLLTTSASKSGLSQSEKEANQLQIDSILQTIDRISSATSFQGTKLLNGNLDFQVSSIAGGVTDFQVNGAKFSGATQGVDILVTQSAQQGGLFLSTGATLNLNGGTNSAFTIEVSGANGSRELQFNSATTVAQIAAAINTFTDVTGVAAAASGGGIKLTSDEFGDNQFVSVKVINDASIQGTGIGVFEMQAADFSTASATVVSTFANAGNGIRDDGQDILATINGVAATTDGKTIRINTDFLDVEATLSTGTAQTLGQVGGAGNSAFTITGGGGTFQLAGQVDIAGRVSLGIGDVSIRKLGNSTNGFLDDLSSGKAFNVVDGNNLETAQKIISTAIDKVSSLRGRLGAFQKNVVGATIRSLNVAIENTTAAESIIRDADFAKETAALTRSQILVQAGTNILSLANSQPQAALQLLG